MVNRVNSALFDGDARGSADEAIEPAAKKRTNGRPVTRAIDVDAETIARWRNGRTEPLPVRIGDLWRYHDTIMEVFRYKVSLGAHAYASILRYDCLLVVHWKTLSDYLARESATLFAPPMRNEAKTRRLFIESFPKWVSMRQNKKARTSMVRVEPIEPIGELSIEEPSVASTTVPIDDDTI